MTPHVSTVIPVYNEAGNIGPLLAELAPVLRSLDPAGEIIVVDDGSTDTTAGELAAAAATLPELRVVRHASRRGQAVALLTGLHAARGEFIATLDGDGQNHPGDLPALYALVAHGEFDLACGRRTPRAATRVRRTMSRVANAVRRRLLADEVHDSGCQLRVMRRAVVGALVPMELMQSFVPALAVSVGFRVGERPVRDRPRASGRSKYGLGRLCWRPAIALFRLWWARRRGPRRPDEGRTT